MYPSIRTLSNASCQFSLTLNVFIFIKSAFRSQNILLNNNVELKKIHGDLFYIVMRLTMIPLKENFQKSMIVIWFKRMENFFKIVAIIVFVNNLLTNFQEVTYSPRV